MNEPAIAHYNSRKTRKEAERKGLLASLRSNRHGINAVILVAILPVLLASWVSTQAFLYLCSVSCRYSEQTPLVTIAMWVFLILAVACVVGIVYNVSESFARRSDEKKSMIAIITAGLLAGYFSSGMARDFLIDAILKVMY